jgi:SCP-2 sterol transfer family
MRRNAPAHEYFERLLASAATADPVNYRRLVREFAGRTTRVLMEETNEEFYVRGTTAGLRVAKRRPMGDIQTRVTISHQVIADILSGVETPVEAFFLGHLRAQGTTAELYQLHRLFITMAEIAVHSEAVQKLVEEFMNEHGSANGDKL